MAQAFLPVVLLGGNRQECLFHVSGVCRTVVKWHRHSCLWCFSVVTDRNVCFTFFLGGVTQAFLPVVLFGGERQECLFHLFLGGVTQAFLPVVLLGGDRQECLFHLFLGGA